MSILGRDGEIVSGEGVQCEFDRRRCQIRSGKGCDVLEQHGIED